MYELGKVSLRRVFVGWKFFCGFYFNCIRENVGKIVVWFFMGICCERLCVGERFFLVRLFVEGIVSVSCSVLLWSWSF